jgi:hypothetical protein
MRFSERFRIDGKKINEIEFEEKKTFQALQYQFSNALLIIETNPGKGNRTRSYKTRKSLVSQENRSHVRFGN